MMLIAASAIQQDGPGIDLSEQPEGVAIKMSDPVQDFEYARNSVTLGAASNCFMVSNRLIGGTVGVYWYTYGGNLYCWTQRSGSFSLSKTWSGGDDAAWHHYVAQRRGTRIEMWRDGVIGLGNDGAANGASVVGASLFVGKTAVGSPSADVVDDLRVYDRALLASEIQGLATP